MIRFLILIVVIVLSLSLVVLSSLNTETSIQDSGVGIKLVSISGSTVSGEKQTENQDLSGSIVENTVDYSQINNSAKIYDAYISDIQTEKLTDIAYNDLYNKEIVDKDSLVHISNTNYYKDKNNVYEYIQQFTKIEGLKPSSVKGILPYKGFTGSFDSITDGRDIYSGGEKVENGEINSLKFKVFGNGMMVSFDKTNLYLGRRQSFKLGNIESLKIVNFSKPKDGFYLNDCFKDDTSIYCMFGEFGGAPYWKVEGVDVESFEHLAGYWYRDKKNVYYTKDKREDLDVNTFEVLDVNTFEVLDDFGSYFKDKNGVYYIGERIEGINPNGFDLDKYLKEKQNPM